MITKLHQTFANSPIHITLPTNIEIINQSPALIFWSDPTNFEPPSGILSMTSSWAAVVTKIVWHTMARSPIYPMLKAIKIC